MSSRAQVSGVEHVDQDKLARCHKDSLAIDHEPTVTGTDGIDVTFVANRSTGRVHRAHLPSPEVLVAFGRVASLVVQPHLSAPTPRSYRYDWALFVDWCTAIDAHPLPASSIMLVEFLGDNPANDLVQLRRVSAINRRHLDTGHTPPGRATSLRLTLDSTRSARIQQRAANYKALAAALPTAGSMEAVFGRRDAVLLLLSAAGLSHTAIATLDRADVVSHGDDVWVGGRHDITIASDASTGVHPAEIWERWSAVLRFSDRYPSTALLAEQLQANTFPDMTGWVERPGPVAVPIDRWGHMPFPAAPMTPAAIGGVIDAHRTGRPPRHHPYRPNLRPLGHHELDASASAAVLQPFSAVPSSEYYRIGIAARHRAHAALADVFDIADDLENRIEQLLQRTLELLDDKAPLSPDRPI